MSPNSKCLDFKPPEGWTVVPLSKLTREQATGTTLRGEGSGDSLPLLKMGNLLWGAVDLRDVERIGLDRIEGVDCLVQHGDLLFNTRNTPELVGKTALWQAPFDAAIDNNIMRIRLHHNVHSGYVAKWMGSDFGRKAIGKFVCASTSVGAVYWRDLKNLALPLPPLSEQKRIAEVLSIWDQAIDAVAALIDNACKHKSALVEALLTGRTRLPKFSSAWTEIRLGQAFGERLERGGEDLDLLSVTRSRGVISQEDAGRRNISAADQSNYKTVRAGDIAYNTMRMWQGASAVSSLTGKVSPAYTVITPREGHDASFYGQLFKKPGMIHVFERHSQGLVSDTWNLKFPAFAKIRISVPGLEEQREIAATLSCADDVVRQHQTQLAALHQEKSALMQTLLTGKRRVKVDA